MLRFQHKMIIAFVLFVLLPILLLGFISYKISSGTLQRNVSNQTIQTLRSVDKNLLAVISEINSFSDYVISSSEIQSYLNTNNTSSIYDFYSKQQEITGAVYGNSQISDFILYSNDGNVTHINSNEIPTLKALQSSELFDYFFKKKGSPLWLTPYENKQFNLSDHNNLTQARVVKDVNNLNDLGYLILTIKLEFIDPIFADMDESPSSRMIVNEEGRILYSLDRHLIGKKINRKQTEAMQKKGTGFLIDRWKREKSLITYIPSNFKTGRNAALFLVSIKPWEEVERDIVPIRFTTIFIVAFTILIAGLFNSLYLKRISLFIQELLAHMKQVESGILEKKMGSFKIKELSNISSGFNSMLNRIQRLISDVEIEQERKRDAQFKVLQQQINPHFLYNTLESINALAALNGQKEISRMTINLGKLLRISINGGYEVKVRDEIRHVISYLEIQKIRYDNRFAYMVDVEEELEHYYVLKLIIQPLVENILNHGFSQQNKQGIIKIRGSIRNGQGELWIEDNGRGMEESILADLNNWKLRKNAAEVKGHGHGIRNVAERLELYYGQRYGLIVCSTEKHGTLIKISFPLKGD
ncbi:sensor histidine kinase [Niallia sp. NCCP-28]|uniref:cache domain-containing sensor histidine kinase n=1 Tax=Niallia sp. NCCP-28 TaxID=2934712 RepID=UPI0020818EA7|nr:sensor histidine kinase [Niallia sp. NCCP-28]GKU82129.1 histidine kinase [Niallia sp. NCCP-28]